MDMAFAAPDENFAKAEKLIDEAAAAGADVLVLPETWNTGFFPKENLPELCDNDGERTKATFGELAKKYSVNIAAGSVANKKGGSVYNTAYVFDRSGKVVAEYDKTHLFTPMGEDNYFVHGNHLSAFTLDGKKCGILICYDIRFPELTRTLTVNEKLDCLFLVAEWPKIRIPHLNILTRARAIENQMFVVCCNSAGKAGGTVYGGHSMIWDPWGELLAEAGGEGKEEIISAECDFTILDGIRNSINVFRDRREELYNIK